MNVLVFGATGMVGQGAVRECLADSQVELIQTVGRSQLGMQHPKLRDLVHRDLFDCGPIEAALTGFDTCLFCLGVSSAGMNESAYTKLPFDLTIAVATTLARLNPGMTFIYVSGTGTDSSEHGRTMWARVKGRTENALLRLPFKRAFMFRPGFIQPMHGIRSKTKLYRWGYYVSAPLYPILKRIFPHVMTTTEEVGRAMILVARHGAPKSILESRDITAIARSGSISS